MACDKHEQIVQRLLAVPATSLEYKKVGLERARVCMARLTRAGQHTLSMEDKSTYRNAERLSKKSDRKSSKGRPSQKRDARDERGSTKREPAAAPVAASVPDANK